MRRDILFASALVVILLGSCVTVTADGSDAATVCTYEEDNCRSLSILSIEWEGTSIPKNLNTSSSPIYYSYDGAKKLDQTMVIYERGSEKGLSFQDWVRTCTGTAVKGSVSSSDSIRSGVSYVMYVFVSIDPVTIASGVTNYTSGKDELHLFQAEWYSAHLFKNNNDFSIANVGTSSSLLVSVAYGTMNDSFTVAPGKELDNKRSATADQDVYYFDTFANTVRAVVTAYNNESGISDLSSLQSQYLMNLSYSVTGEWKSASNGSGAVILAPVLVIIGAAFIAVKVMMNRKPGWSK